MIIAISSSSMKIKTNIFPDKFYLNADYVKSLLALKQDLGVMMIPYCNKQNAKELLKRSDGLILSGGFDISPCIYGEKPKKLLGKTCKKRDIFELDLLECALEIGLNVFGICRGMQLINVFFGGHLYQDLSYMKTEQNHIQKEKPSKASHRVKIIENSFLSAFLPKNIWVNSFHHQAISSLGENLKICAKNKKIIEGIELKESKNLVFGVQWHPEVMKDQYSKLIFKKFLENCCRNEK